MKSRSRNVLSILVVIAMLIGLVPAMSFATIQIDQQYADTNKGVTELLRDLQALPNLGNVLYMGAHPDDESNAFLANLYWGFKVDGGYAVSNWGEGGDNWIGQELYGALGVIRSQELLAARMFDRCKQFYIGAYDFGYSVSLAESLIENNTLSANYQQAGNWKWQIYAYNLARLIRKDRPDVFISGHWGYGGHGQHQANGYIARAAYAMAGDPTYVVKDYDGTELPAWQPAKLYASTSATYTRNADGTIPTSTQITATPALKDNLTGNVDLVVDNGVYDNLLAMSYAEWGNLGRGMHKCQNVSPSAPKGESKTTWGLKAKTAAVTTATDSSTLFGGVDISYDRIYKEITDATRKAAVKVITDQMKLDAAALRDTFSITNYLNSTDEIAAFSADLDALQTLIGTPGYSSEAAVADGVTQHWIDLLRARINKITNQIYAVSIDITSNDYDLTPGQTAVITVKTYVRQAGAASAVTFPATSMSGGLPTMIKVPSGWTVTENTAPANISQNSVVIGKTYIYNVTVPENYTNYTGPFNAPYDEYMPSRNASFPYGSLSGSASTWNSETTRATAEQITAGITTVSYQPYSVSPITASATFTAAAHDYTAAKVPSLRIVPKVSLLLNNENAMLKKSPDGQESVVAVVVKNNMTTAAENIVVSAAVSGWTGDSETISIASQGGEQTVYLHMQVPADYEGSKQVQVLATYGAHDFNEGFQVINYSHINQQNYYRASIQNLTVSDFAVSDGLRVGYVVTGMDDYVVDYIRLMYNVAGQGTTNVTKLTTADLTNGAALKARFDTIVVGKMAWTNLPAIQTKVGVLTDFANAGGNLVVHYQNARVSNRMPLAPVPFLLGGTNINNENAAVLMNFGTQTQIEANRFYYGIDLGLTGTGPFTSTSSVWNGWKQQRTEWTPGNSTTNPIGDVTTDGYQVLFYGLDPGDATSGRPAIIYMPMANGGSYTYSAIVWERQLQSLVPGAYKLYANLLSMTTRDNVTVNFESNGGTDVTALSVKPGSLIEAPSEPWKLGFDFGGWYSDAALTTLWDFAADTVTEETTLYAKWSASVETVTFDSNGGTAVGSVDVDFGDLVAAPAAPTKDGYVFVGWFRDSAMARFTMTEEVTNTPWDFAHDTVTYSTTLYAHWLKTPVTNLVAKGIGYNFARLTWTATEGAQSYAIFRATSQFGTYALVATVDGDVTTADITGLTMGRTYYFKIVSYATCLNKTVYSGYSNIASAKPMPAQPTGLAAHGINPRSIVISWNAVDGATGYDIWRSAYPTTGWTYYRQTTGLSVTNSLLTLGKTYYYHVRAYRTVGGVKYYGPFTAVISSRPGLIS
jgi:uncharacterized repeat protein (TIGR02543 family)